MIFINLHISLIAFAIFLVVKRCVEPFQFLTQTEDGILVIDARITDKEKLHQIVLSRTRPFDKDISSLEQNTNVKIIDTNGSLYDFRQIENVLNESISVLAAKQNSGYRLEIRTSNVTVCTCEMMGDPQKIENENITVDQDINDSK